MRTLNETANEELRVLRSVALPEVAYKHLNGLIMSGEIKAGAHINESQIAEQLGINRAPIREACRQLEQDGLVKIEKNRGVFLRDIPADEALELYDIRASLEGLAAQNAAERWTNVQLEELKNCMNEMRSASAAGDMKTLYLHASHFHKLIVGMAGSSHLANMVNGVSRKISVFRFKLSESSDSTTSCKDEEAIVAAIEARDGNLANELMKNHVLGGKARILRNFVPDESRN